MTRADDGTPVKGARVWGSWRVVDGEGTVTDEAGQYAITLVVRCFESSCIGPSLVADLDGFDEGLEPGVIERVRMPTSDTNGAYRPTVEDACAVVRRDRYLSMGVRAVHGSRRQVIDFSDLTAEGDSLELEASFSELR